MQTNLQATATRDNGISIVDRLMIEHRVLREQMRKLDNWSEQGLSDEVLQERAALLSVALEAHARLEEERLFASLRRRSEEARQLIELMELDHDQIRMLFGEIQQGWEVKPKLELVLDLAERHFVQEEDQLFPLAAGLPEAN